MNVIFNTDSGYYSKLSLSDSSFRILPQNSSAQSPQNDTIVILMILIRFISHLSYKIYIYIASFIRINIVIINSIQVHSVEGNQTDNE